MSVCDRCQGRGWVRVKNGLHPEIKECPACLGKGEA